MNADLKILFHKAALFSLLTSCQQSGTTGGSRTRTSEDARRCFALVNGQIDETKNFDAVVALVDSNNRLCTGTFVAHNTLLTAAHCVDTKKVGGGLSARLGGRYVKALRAVIPQEKGQGGEIPTKFDFAVLVYPNDTAKSWLSLSAFPPKPEQRITLVGFGQTDFLNDNKSDGKRRVGENQIVELSENGTALVYDLPVSEKGLPTSKDAMTARGDSGGPVLLGNGIVGIVSRSPADPIDGRIKAYDTNLFREEAEEFLRLTTTKYGAKISGLEEMQNALKGIATGDGSGCI